MRTAEIQVQTEPRKTGKALLDSSWTACPPGYRTQDWRRGEVPACKLGEERQGCVRSRFLAQGRACRARRELAKGKWPAQAARGVSFSCSLLKLEILPDRENQRDVRPRGNIATSAAGAEAAACPCFGSSLGETRGRRDTAICTAPRRGDCSWDSCPRGEGAEDLLSSQPRDPTVRAPLGETCSARPVSEDSASQAPGSLRALCFCVSLSRLRAGKSRGSELWEKEL